VAEAGGSRTAAVVLLSQPNGGAFFFQFFPPFLAFPAYISVPLLVDSFPPLFGLFSLRFSLFFSFSLFSPFSLFRVSFFSSVFFVFSSLLRPPSPQRSWVLFIEPRAWLFTALMGSSRLVGHWARLPRFGPPPRFSGRCAVGGRPLCSVGGLQAREGKNSN